MSKLVYRLPPDLTKVDLKALVLAVKEIQNLLSPPPTKEELEEALDTAGELNALDYTQQSWQELAAAVLEGNQVLEAVDATQEQIDDATQDINIAIDNLVEWTPAEEFSNGELGVYFDPEDTSTLFQDSAGTTPVTGDGQPVGLMLDKSGNGHHAIQSTTAAKPTYTRVGDTFGLEHDDVDDVIPFSVPNYTGRISAAGSFRGSPSNQNYNVLRSGVVSGPYVLLGDRGHTGTIVSGNAGGESVVTRVDGQLFTGNRDDLYYRWTSPAKDIQITAENIAPTSAVWADQAQTLVFGTTRPGGVLYAYIEVEKPAFDDLPRLEHWLAKKAGITL